jgi:YggT family protein
MLASMSIAQTVLSGIGIFLSIYSVMLIIRFLLSWFPMVDWVSPPFSILYQLTEPYLALFRQFIPPLGGFDVSSILALLTLQFLQRVLLQSAYMISSMALTYS